MNEKAHFLVAGLLWIVMSVLICGRMLGATWAGGNGITIGQNALVSELSGNVTVGYQDVVRTLTTPSMVRRGEIIRTGDRARAKLRLGFANVVFLDERTDVEMTKLTNGDCRLRLIQGRLLIDTHQSDDHNGNAFGTVSISTARTETVIQYGKLSVVNYNFRDTVSVIPIETVAAVTYPGGGTVTYTPIDIHETEPVTITDITFDPAASAAKSFYEWARVVEKN